MRSPGVLARNSEPLEEAKRTRRRPEDEEEATVVVGDSGSYGHIKIVRKRPGRQEEDIEWRRGRHKDSKESGRTNWILGGL